MLAQSQEQSIQIDAEYLNSLVASLKYGHAQPKPKHLDGQTLATPMSFLAPSGASIAAPTPIFAHQIFENQSEADKNQEKADAKKSHELLDAKRLEHKLQFSSLIYEITESQNRTIQILIKLTELKNQQDTPSETKGPSTSSAISEDISQSKTASSSGLALALTSLQSPVPSKMQESSGESLGEPAELQPSSPERYSQSTNAFDGKSPSAEMTPSASTISASPKFLGSPNSDNTNSTNQLFAEKRAKHPVALSATDSKVIGKKKLWRTMQVLNEKTGRFNQRRQCKVCLKTFGKMSNVKDHVRTHNQLKPFSCSFCPQTFSQQGNRDRHQKRRVCQMAATQQ